MKLLIDANLSPRLVEQLSDFYPGSMHVYDHGSNDADDAAIWEIAKLENFVILSRDSDFLDLSLLRGAPPKVILLRVGNVATSAVESILRRQYEPIRRFVNDTEETILIIDR